MVEEKEKRQRAARPHDEQKMAKSYREIMEMPVNSQRDFLVKYIANQKVMELGREGRKRGRYNSSLEELAKHSKEITQEMNIWGLNTSEDKTLRLYRLIISEYLDSLKIDTSIFKASLDKNGKEIVGRKYVMTAELGELFAHILQAKDHSTSKIRHNKFTQISRAEWRKICVRIERAVNAAECSKERKAAAMPDLYKFLEENHVPVEDITPPYPYEDIPFTDIKPHNWFVDVILDEIWEIMNAIKWKPDLRKYLKENNYGFVDDYWTFVSELLYDSLYECGYLKAEVSSHPHMTQGVIVSTEHKYSPEEIKAISEEDAKYQEEINEMSKNIVYANQMPGFLDEIKALEILSDEELI